MDNDDLYNKAKDAITELFNDTTVDPSQTIANLEP
jgi:hypothetical protein